MPEQVFSDALHVELFIAGDSSKSRGHVTNLEKLLLTRGGEHASVTVIDLLLEPEKAAEMDILAIPTVIRRTPPPSVRIIGELTDGERVWAILSN